LTAANLCSSIARFRFLSGSVAGLGAKSQR
jgi:hypothetical protein